MTEPRSIPVPADRHYEGIHHVWAQHDAVTQRVRVGIDAIGLESLGELAYVAVRDVGTSVAKGESIGSLEAAKMTTNIVAPISGTIVARNEAVLENPQIINADPYDAGWIVEIDPRNFAAEAAELVSGDAVSDWAAAAVARLETETS